MTQEALSCAAVKAGMRCRLGPKKPVVWLECEDGIHHFGNMLVRIFPAGLAGSDQIPGQADDAFHMSLP